MYKMDCERVRGEEIAERYLLGRLTDRDRDAFESHFFECERCFDELRALQAVATELQRTEVARPQVSGRVPALVWAAVALLIAMSAGIWISTRQSRAPAPTVIGQQQPAPSGTDRSAQLAADALALAELARVDPPPYVTIALRSAGEDRFEAAMADYTRGDYTSAAERLRAIGDADPSPPRVPFYLGVSELMIGAPDAAMEALGRVTTAGQAAYAEHAHLLLAKAWLGKHRVPEARRELTACIALRGAHAEEARQLLERIDAATRTKN